MAHQANKPLIGLALAAVVASAALWEGDRRTAYEDIVGVWTVCYGHTGKDVVRNRTYTKQECEALLAKDIASHEKGVLKCTNVPLSQDEQHAYTLFAYNVGVNAYCNSSLLKKLNAGDRQGACNGLLKWVYAEGKYVKGLYNRRVYERQICVRGLSEPS